MIAGVTALDVVWFACQLVAVIALGGLVIFLAWASAPLEPIDEHEQRCTLHVTNTAGLSVDGGVLDVHRPGRKPERVRYESVSSGTTLSGVRVVRPPFDWSSYPDL